MTRHWFWTASLKVYGEIQTGQPIQTQKSPKDREFIVLWDFSQSCRACYCPIVWFRHTCSGWADFGKNHGVRLNWGWWFKAPIALAPEPPCQYDSKQCLPYLAGDGTGGLSELLFIVQPLFSHIISCFANTLLR